MYNSPMCDYKQVINLSSWDKYSVNGLDDLAFGNFTLDTPANDLLPFPNDAEDPDEAIRIKRIRKHISHFGWENLPDADVNDTEVTPMDVLITDLGWFEFDQTDESLAAYRTERKEAIVQMHLIFNRFKVYNSTQYWTYSPFMPIMESVVDFQKALVFPLNPALKYAYFGDSASQILNADENLNYDIYYRVTRTPLDFLGRIIGLLRQELSA